MRSWYATICLMISEALLRCSRWHLKLVNALNCRASAWTARARRLIGGEDE